PEIAGLKAYASLKDVPGDVEMIVVVTPSKFVPGIMEEAGQKGVRGAVIITAGFREAGPEGRELENQVVETAKRYGIRVVGPNCLGLIDTWTPINATFAGNTTSEGSIAFASQSGALAVGVLDYALAANINFSQVVSLGNKADVDEVALFEEWAANEHTNVIMTYIEGLRDGGAFIKAARATAQKKPIIAVKSGRTASGSKAVSSHTGSLAGADAAYDAAFAQTGLLRADSVQELFDYAIAFAYQPLIKGNRVAFVTNAGGPGVMATDALERNGLVLAELSAETQQYLSTVLPAAANIHNPVDVLGDALSDRYQAALSAVLKDPGVDGVIVILTPQSGTEIPETADVLVEASNASSKPILACFIGGTRAGVRIEILAKNRVPHYPYPERAVAALGAMNRYHLFRQKPPVKIESFDVDRKAVADLFAAVRKGGRKEIGDTEAQAILKAYGITTPKSKTAATPDEAIAFSNEIGYPVVAKIASPDILHKSEAKGIIVGVKNDQQMREAFATLLQRAKEYKADAKIWGVQVQEMVSNAREVIIGMNSDPQFGPMVMFGLGGIYVEVLKDVIFRVAPMSRSQVEEMVASIRSYKLLTGVRGQPPADIESIVDTILRISQLVTDFPEIASLDINPMMVREQGKGGVAVDMRLFLK
ncbi:MAG: CoA-binding protein, partial [Chloroflexi bacterium]|nr:CoA-binding protein [Chloroflexota bacterium]